MATLAVSATVIEILMLKARKWPNFPTPPLFEAPRSGGTPWNVGMKFGIRKLESWATRWQMVKKSWR